MSAADGLRIAETGGRVRFSVRLQPRASKNELIGVHGDALKIRVTAPPVEGAANGELIAFLSKIFAVSKRDVMIVAGETSRSKIVEIAGITERTVRDIVGGVATTS